MYLHNKESSRFFVRLFAYEERLFGDTQYVYCIGVRVCVCVCVCVMSALQRATQGAEEIRFVLKDTDTN